MNSKDILARIGVVVAIVIAIIACFTPVGRQVAGTILDTFSGDYFNATTGYQIASVAQDKTCDLIGMAVTQSATSTTAYDCAISGLTSSFTITGQLATSSQSTLYGGWVVTGAHASTTAGFATITVLNLTGASASMGPTGVGSSTRIHVFK